jgi:hypothetical protein
LRINLEGPEYRRYIAIVKAVSTEGNIWRRGGLTSRVGRSGRAVTLRIPARAFRKSPLKDYLLILTGVMASGETEEVNQYYFHVEKH